MARIINCAIIRGGSSKGIFVEDSELPDEGAERDEAILALFGSPDLRQIDGLGGADKLTSKAAVMAQPTRVDCDIDYTFGQVNLSLPRIDWASNCGNLSAGAAVYAAHFGYAPTDSDFARIAIHQVNTGRRLLATVPLQEGRPAVRGDFAIGGVPGTGARIDLDFADFAGCTLGRGVLPTGQALNRFDVPQLGLVVEASIIDMANLHVFVRAADLGLSDMRNVLELQANSDVIARLEAVRATVAREIGVIAETDADEELLVRMNPLLYAVAPPRDYTTLSNAPIQAGDMDVFARSITRATFSKAYPASGAVGTAIACGIPGTIANEIVAHAGIGPGKPYKVRVGHPSGLLEVEAETARLPSGLLEVCSAVVGRTGRVIMEGKAYLRDAP
jgi:2-methylaconitate cis-trans-isomerase PrpF